MPEPVYSANGQLISPSDPNYAAYAAQNNPAPASSLVNIRNDVGGTGTGASGTTGGTTTPEDPLAAGKKYADDVFSGYTSSMSVDQIRAQEAARKARLAEEAERLFAPKIAEAEKLGEQRLGSTKGQLGITRGLGLSTAELSYINAVQSENDARIGEIKKQKEEYIASGNFKYAELADASIAKLEETQNNILLNKSKLALDYTNYLLEDRKQKSSEKLAQDKFEYDVYKDERDFAVGQDRFERTQAVQEGWLSRSLTDDDRKLTQDNIAKLANSGISINEFSDEDITALEARAGYVPGSFEAIYNRAVEQAKMGDTMDALKLQQLKNDVAKSFKSLSEGDKKVEPDKLSGKFSESYLANRANDFVNEDDTVDWGSVDELQDTDKDLWKDISIILNAKVQQDKEQQGADGQASGGYNVDKYKEKGKGYFDAEGNFVRATESPSDKDMLKIMGITGNDTGAFFTNLFGG